MGNNEKLRRNGIIAIAGPTASGKSYLANTLLKIFGHDNVSILSMDQYYKNWSHLPISKRREINFDHPDSFDMSLIMEHLKKLKSGFNIKAPLYSYRLHKRLKKLKSVRSNKLIIIEGLFTLHTKSLRRLADIKIYVDIDQVTSISRRLKRDLKQRGENIDSICRMYFNNVLPMQNKYIILQKNYSDIIVCGKEPIKNAISKINALIKNNISAGNYERHG